ncbi:histidinol-phosphatase [Candidatus Albibeggiatoa sp. nov. BB20]|uniref:histidinol-phosphatase n=1 Tax=Candidatus Albibeggiatoa sp. nov. BB20 TaxID=3162723 RepID=UPI0033654027
MLDTLPLEFIGLAHRLADASGTVIRQYFRTPIFVDDKADASPVTIADREAERIMRELIQQVYPQHGIYGEEMGVKNKDAEFVWVLDPIDGTKSFITGKPLFGTLIALLHYGQPILGMIDQPITRERWVGGLNLPTTLNGQTVKVRNCPELNQAILYATTPLMFEGQDKIAFERLCQQIKLPLYGADCYAYALLAMGLVDLVVEADLSPYDYCSHIPIIEQAGGIITDWQGKALGLESDGRVVAAGDKALHQKVLDILS